LTRFVGPRSWVKNLRIALWRAKTPMLRTISFLIPGITLAGKEKQTHQTSAAHAAASSNHNTRCVKGCGVKNQSQDVTPLTKAPDCYDMEIGENRVHVFYGTEKREKEKDSRYIQEASAPAAVTVYQTYNMSPAHVHQ